MAAPQPRLSALPPGAMVRMGGSVLALAYCVICALAPFDFLLLHRLWFLPGIGVVGAIVANTSGTGGGVVFVPVFNALREQGVMALDPLRITAVSMGIQCFGMSMGALRWTDRLYHQPAPAAGSKDALVDPRDYFTAVLCVLALALPTLLITQRIGIFDRRDVLIGYKTFSIIFGLALLVTTWTVNRQRPERGQLERIDLIALLLLAIPGGVLTAYFSVGLGELVALYLFIRHYPVLLCTGVACCLSAVSVIAGSVWHIAHGTMQWEVVMLAAPGAVLGGFLARPIALWLGARRLKTLDGSWIVLAALYLIWLSAR
ncbi:TSUP family transporter [Porphyrobacter algicida]|uniref:Probable membrane transporter protein n=1 Tax=Qipengyuania algicida TaxID=1836209 RepID=A0A845AGD0_9SPHN|nr:TSUP family transporter [Qipengyuania algicida]